MVPKLKTLNEKMKSIVSDFFTAQRNLRLRKAPLSSIDAESNIYVEAIEKVSNAFEALDEEEKRIINNDFFYQDYPFWWMDGYSKSTYYRLKRKAVIHFIEAYER